MNYSFEIANGKLSITLTLLVLPILVIGIVSGYQSSNPPDYFGHTVDEIEPGTFSGSNDFVFPSGSTLDIRGDLIGNGITRTFIRWGSDDAISGISANRVYSGIGFNKYYGANGPGSTPLCLQSGDPGVGSTEGNSDRIHPITTHTNDNNLPIGIFEDVVVKCAMHSTNRVVFTSWGTDDCPSGWTKAYSGYSLSATYDEAGEMGRICADNINFESDISSSSSRARIAGTKFTNIDGTTGYTDETYVRCAVCLKS